MRATTAAVGTRRRAALGWLPLPPLELGWLPDAVPEPDPPVALDPPADDDELCAPVPFSLIAFRVNPSIVSRVALTLPMLMTPTPPMPQVVWS